jgi:hypothetical protein
LVILRCVNTKLHCNSWRRREFRQLAHFQHLANH